MEFYILLEPFLNMATLNELTTITPTIDDLVPSLDAAGTTLQKTTWQAIRDLYEAYFDTQYPSGSWTSTWTNTWDNAVNTLYSWLAASKLDATAYDDATAAEVTTWTSTAKYVSPDSLAGSTIFWVKTVQLFIFDNLTEVTTWDGKSYFVVPQALNGMNLVRVHALVLTAWTTWTTDIQIANVTDTVDMLSTKLTIDSTETWSDTAATPAVIDTTKDDVATNDLIRIDVDATSTTKAKGLIITLEFQLP